MLNKVFTYLLTYYNYNDNNNQESDSNNDNDNYNDNENANENNKWMVMSYFSLVRAALKLALLNWIPLDKYWI